MSIELTILAWGCVLALIHVFAAAHAKTRQYGAKWNMGSRDEGLPEPAPLVGRLVRAQSNFFETLPIAVAAILMVEVAHLNNRWTVAGAIVWLTARALYLPLYALGVPVIRTLTFMAALAGLLMVLVPAFL